MRFVLILATLFLAVPAASAKEFRPGEILLCGATQCRIVTDGQKSRLFGEFLYGAGRVAVAPTPRVGSPVFQMVQGRARRGHPQRDIRPGSRSQLRPLPARTVVSAPAPLARLDDGPEADVAPGARPTLLLKRP